MATEKSESYTSCLMTIVTATYLTYSFVSKTTDKTTFSIMYHCVDYCAYDIKHARKET